MDAPVDAAEWVCEVVRLAQSGEGIALWDGRALFIPGAFPKERVLAKKTAHPQRAELLKILEASPERRPPPCPHHNKCGG
ncbi:MAG: class I SAM-dependent RNA methyltransferase, partial [Cystobacterineae bacterium]|nr:class I SAM-dependent RNA methyltransferase [Cystobacterineae bacterium]